MENFTHGSIVPIKIEDEMQKSYIDYSMSVIVGRALPDVRDGLKPVHRRILYSMFRSGITPASSYKKSAHVVGDVLGKYHPHGDMAVYDAMVRMAQPFSTRYLLVDGHGNFGSVDGDSAAAMRYTEVKMASLAMELLSDIDKDTVHFGLNYDESHEEPTVLPSRYPNLLVNGSSGIAVGMATNIPPHNLGEVIDGVVAMIENPDVTVADLAKIIKGPDFPTAGIIMGRAGIKSGYETGRGSVKVRARANIETTKGNRVRIIVTELPYLVNKSRLIERIAELVKDKKIEGISDLRDESDRKGMRIVIELRKDAYHEVVLNQLYKFTQMESTFGMNMLALVHGEPRVLNLREMIFYYLEHQKDVIVRRTKFELNKAEERVHIVEGLRIALDNLDAVIKLIRASRTTEEARTGLMTNFKLSERQAQAILDMRLQRLTGLEIDKLEVEYKELLERIAYLKKILGSEQLVLEIIEEEIVKIRDKFADPRRTEISHDENLLEIEDLIAEEDIVITISYRGYIKRVPTNTYRSQRRGGKGIMGMTTHSEDFVEKIFITTTHNFLLFFTSKGKVYRLKGYEIPEAGRQARGTAIINLLRLKSDEKITAVIPLKEYTEGNYLVTATRAGLIKKTALPEYDSSRRDGLICVTLNDNDELIRVQLTDGEQDILMTTRNGQAIRFSEDDVRATGRSSKGVIGIRMDEEDYLVGMEIVQDNSKLLVITDKGFGKQTQLKEYRSQARGGKGIMTLRRTDRNGYLVDAKVVREGEEMLAISREGVIIRMKINEISAMGRATQGVLIMRLNPEDEVVAIALVPEESGE